MSSIAMSPSPAAAQRWAFVDTGWQHACALDGEGRAYCWGENHRGQLGAPTPDRCRADPGGGAPYCAPSPSAVPVAVTGGHRFGEVRAGSGQTCALDLEHRLFCWGFGFGPNPVTPSHAAGRRYYSLGEANAVICAAEQPTGGRCWSTADSTWQTIREFPDVRFRSVAPGPNPSNRFCGLAEDGKLLCTGHNYFGQLGVLSPDTTAEYVEPAGRRSYRQIAMAREWTCGLTNEGKVFCWGDFLREMYAPSAASAETCSSGVRCVATPRPVAPETVFTNISVFDTEVCGVATTGALYCWKRDGQVSHRATRLRFRAISGGGMGWCGLSQSGEIYCWHPNDGDTNLVPIARPAAPASR